MEIDHVLLTRFQFGFTASVHIIFPSLLIGLCSYILVMEALWLKTKRQVYREQWQFWIKPFAGVFILAIITGVMLSFQLDTFFSGFYYKVAAVLVPIRKIEFANAILIEAASFGIMVWGWRRVGPKLHFLATIMMQVGILISMICVLARNSWMQTPAGYVIADNGALQLANMFEVIFNPSFPYRFFHMLGAAYLSTAFVILGICAWYLLRQRHRSFARFGVRAALLVIAVLAPLQIFSGDLHGLNTKIHQPAKLAAMEGLWKTTEGAPLVLFAVPDSRNERNRFAIEIPKLASLIITHDLDGKIVGLEDIPAAERPNVPIVFYAFRVMVGMGMLMLLVGVIGLVLLRKQRLYGHRWYLRLCCLSIPSGLLATIAGWCVTEAGRQPWVAYGLIKTADVISPLPVAQDGHFLTSVVIAYLVLFSMLFYGLWRVLARGPGDHSRAATASWSAPGVTER